MPEQIFIDTNHQNWHPFDLAPSTTILPLAMPVLHGSIHKLRMVAGTTIPIHYHPSDEYVYVLSGTVKTGGQICEAGTFRFTPANTKNGPHHAIVEIVTI